MKEFQNTLRSIGIHRGINKDEPNERWSTFSFGFLLNELRKRDSTSYPNNEA